jgi:hypothetical protein
MAVRSGCFYSSRRRGVESKACRRLTGGFPQNTEQLSVGVSASVTSPGQSRPLVRCFIDKVIRGVNAGGRLTRLRHSWRLGVLAVIAALAGTSAGNADIIVSDGTLFSRPGYDYGPSVIQEGDIQRFWWCGLGTIPGTGTQTDVVFYRSVNLTTRQWTNIQEVLWPSWGQWDGVYTCDPSVVAGRFRNPTDGHVYTYAMYYTATDLQAGTNGRIGLAYSNDGTNWVKYSGNPVILPEIYPTTRYGAGQAATVSYDEWAGIWLFYTDTSVPERGDRILVRTTTDGIHFSSPTVVPDTADTGGIVATANSDFAYDTASRQIYAALALRSRAGDRETYHFGLYTILAAALMQGTGTWKQLAEISTNTTGYYLNHSPGLLRDRYGRVTPWLPNTLEAYFAGGTNDPATWDLTWVTWHPTPASLPLNRFYNKAARVHWVTSGFVPPGFGLEGTLGYLPMTHQPGTEALFSCQAGLDGLDQFVSRDPACEGHFVLGPDGWIYTSPIAGKKIVPLYRCYTGSDHFVSNDAKCELSMTEGQLGYALVRKN